VPDRLVGEADAGLWGGRRCADIGLIARTSSALRGTSHSMQWPACRTSPSARAGDRDAGFAGARVVGRDVTAASQYSRPARTGTRGRSDRRPRAQRIGNAPAACLSEVPSRELGVRQGSVTMKGLALGAEHCAAHRRRVDPPANGTWRWPSCDCAPEPTTTLCAYGRRRFARVPHHNSSGSRPTCNFWNSRFPDLDSRPREWAPDF